jgi:hypothetical protein
MTIVSFQALTGLADGLALKELRYAADAGDSPQPSGSPALRGMSAEIQRKVGGTLANAKTESRPPGRSSFGKCAQNGRGPSMRGLSVSGPVSRILSRAIICLPGAFAPRGPLNGPAAYLDLAGPGRRSCLALHRAGFAWPPRRRDAGALLPHHFTFACTRLTCGRAIGRVISVALSRGFPRVGTTHRHALRCPDFPRGVFSPRDRSARDSMVALRCRNREGCPRSCGGRRSHGRGRWRRRS